MELNKLDKELDEFYVSLIAQFMQVQDDCDREINILEQERLRLRGYHP